MGLTSRRLLGSRLRRIIIGILVIAVALSAGAYAYWTYRPSQIGPEVSLISPPFEFSMSLDKSSYSLAENMTISFYLRNISNETVTIGKNSMDPGPGKVTTASEGVTIQGAPSRDLNVLFHFGYKLYSSNGTVINQDLEGQLQAGYLLVLESNASLNQTVSINLATYTDQFLQPLQKASYQITGVLHAGVTNAEQNIWETPSIAFTVS